MGKQAAFFYEFPFDEDREDLAEQIIEFWNKHPSCFRQSSDNPARLIFRAGSRSNWIFDLKMVEGQLRLFSEEDQTKQESLGLQKRAFVKDIDLISHNMISILTTDQEEGKWQRTATLRVSELDLAETIQTELPVIVRVPIKDMLFAVSKTSISLVNLAESKEYVLVKQRVQSEHDCISNAFVTFQSLAAPTDSVEKKVVKVTLHYFEKVFFATQELKRCTYNTFDLADDFLAMINACGLIIPSKKTKLVSQLRQIKEASKPVSDQDKASVSKVIREVRQELKPLFDAERDLQERVIAHTRKIQEIQQQFEDRFDQENQQFRIYERLD